MNIPRSTHAPRGLQLQTQRISLRGRYDGDADRGTEVSRVDLYNVKPRRGPAHRARSGADWRPAPQTKGGGRERYNLTRDRRRAGSGNAKKSSE